MKNLETSGLFAQTADQIKGICGIPLGKKLMALNDNEEFIAMVISFAEKRSMTISNIKDAIQEAIIYMEDNAILNTDLEDQSYSETVGINSGAEQNYYSSHEELIKCIRNAGQSLKQKKSDADSKDREDGSKVCEKIDAGKDKDKVITESIFDLLLRSYAPDGISIKEVEEILRKVYEMFEYTTIIPIVEEQTSQPEQVNAQAGWCGIARIAEALSQKIQEFVLK